MEFQVAKAETILSQWGIPRRRLLYWLDEGVIEAKHKRHGRGGIRLLTETSLLDAYLVANMREVLPDNCLRAAIRAARKLYGDWLVAQPERVRFDCWVSTQRRVTVEFPILSALRLVRALHERPARWQVHRGRPVEDWRQKFEEDLAEIAASLQASQASRPPLRDEIAAYRRRRLEESREAHVTVTP